MIKIKKQSNINTNKLKDDIIIWEIEKLALQLENVWHEDTYHKLIEMITQEERRIENIKKEVNETIIKNSHISVEEKTKISESWKELYAKSSLEDILLWWKNINATSEQDVNKSIQYQVINSDFS